MNRGHIIILYLAHKTIFFLLAFYFVCWSQLSQAATKKRLELFLGHSSLNIQSADTGLKTAFSGVALTGEYSLLFSKSFSLGFLGTYQELTNSYSDDSDGIEYFTTGGGGFSLNAFLGSKKTTFIRNEFTYNQIFIDQIEGDIDKSHSYTGGVWRATLGYLMGGKKFNFTISQSIEYHLLSGGKDTLNDNAKVGDLAGIGGTTYISFAYNL